MEYNLKLHICWNPLHMLLSYALSNGRSYVRLISVLSAIRCKKQELNTSFYGNCMYACQRKRGNKISLLGLKTTKLKKAMI